MAHELYTARNGKPRWPLLAQPPGMVWGSN